MATITHVQSGIDAEFSYPSCGKGKYEKHLDFESLSELSNGDLDEWIEDYLNHLPAGLRKNDRR
jgi:hypothetical protein